MIASEANLGGLPIAAGDVLLKKYRVERLIGEGGTGVVLSATHLQLERRVAIKLLRQSLADDELRMRFEREARAIGAIESDHVVLVLDAGSLDDGCPYMVMEYLDGRDLARVLKEDGPLPIEAAVDCMLQVCEALGQAHDCGIVHRDLKPANLLLTRDEDGHAHVKVVDFGISKILDKTILEADGQPYEVTSAFSALGSPRWMAPEQIRNSKDVDGRADLWSVGAVLFQLISGKHAFDVEGNVQASVAVLTAEPRRLSSLVPDVPPELDAIVSKCLTKDVTKRFQSASELAEALHPFASDLSKDSLESAKCVPSLQIAISPTSTPPTGGEGMLPAGTRDAPTERRLPVAPSSSSSSPPWPVRRASVSEGAPRGHAAPTSGGPKLMLASLGVAAFSLVLVVFLVFGSRLRGSSAGRPDARFRSEATVPASRDDAGLHAPASR